MGRRSWIGTVVYHDIGLVSFQMDDVFVPSGVVRGVFDSHDHVRVDSVIFQSDVRPIVELGQCFELLCCRVGADQSEVLRKQMLLQVADEVLSIHTSAHGPQVGIQLTVAAGSLENRPSHDSSASQTGFPFDVPI